MASETIKFEIIGSVAKISLHRPNVFNSFNQEMSKACQAALDECASNEAVRAIYLTGEGKAFCAGQDLSEAIDPNGPDIKRIVDEHYNPLIQAASDDRKTHCGGCQWCGSRCGGKCGSGL